MQTLSPFCRRMGAPRAVCVPTAQERRICHSWERRTAWRSGSLLLGLRDKNSSLPTGAKHGGHHGHGGRHVRGLNARWAIQRERSLQPRVAGQTKSRAQNANCVQAQPGRGDRTRTCGLVVPNHARYQLRNTSTKASRLLGSLFVFLLYRKRRGSVKVIRYKPSPARLRWSPGIWRTGPGRFHTWFAPPCRKRSSGCG